jgi:CBS domain-containing protein
MACAWRGARQPPRPPADLLRKDPPTCLLADRLGAVRDRLREAAWDLCIVVGEDSTVLGRLRLEAFPASPEESVEAVMESGPTTIRPDVSVASLLPRLRQKNVHDVVVTTSDGRLLGVLYLEDAERHAAGSGAVADNEEACECGV